MTEKRIETILTLYITPPGFKHLNEDARSYFNDTIRREARKNIPLRREARKNIPLISVYMPEGVVVKVNKPELWEFRITYSNNGEKVLKQIFYEGYK